MSQKDGCISVKRSLGVWNMMYCNFSGIERGKTLELHSKNIRKILLIILFAVVAYTMAQNMEFASQVFSWIVAVLSPFITGLCLAFILNVPLKFLEETVFASVNRSGLRSLNIPSGYFAGIGSLFFGGAGTEKEFFPFSGKSARLYE